MSTLRLRQYRFIPALALAVGVAACSKPTTTAGGTYNGVSLTDILTSLNAAAQAGCAIEPTAADATALIIKSDVRATNALAIGKQVADILCAAYKATPATNALKKASPGATVLLATVEGVPVYGKVTIGLTER